MDPTMEAAVISGCFGLLGVAGTVWVAIAGFRANRRISSESVWIAPAFLEALACRCD